MSCLTLAGGVYHRETDGRRTKCGRDVVLGNLDIAVTCQACLDRRGNGTEEIHGSMMVGRGWPLPHLSGV